MTRILLIVILLISCNMCISSQNNNNQNNEHNDVPLQIIELLKNEDSVNIDTLSAQDILPFKNDEYIIDGKIDLGGKMLILPKKSTLTFKGDGLFYNGYILGNLSNIKCRKNGFIFDGIVIKGSWNVSNIYSTWFSFNNNPIINALYFRDITALCDDSIKNKIYIDSGDYSVCLDKNNPSLLEIKNNTKLILNGDITLEGNNLTQYQILRIWNKQNIIIEGRGSLKGDILSHIGNNGEWGMGVSICNSKNVKVKDIIISNCWGDCIYIGQTKNENDNYSSDVIISNVTCEAGRRQGISITAGKNLMIKQCRIMNTGAIKKTPPTAGIDIEPNIDNAVLDNIVIKDCVFRGNTFNHDLQFYRLNNKSKILVEQCILPAGVVLCKNVWGVTFKDCHISELKDLGDYSSKQKFIKTRIDHYK